MLVSIDSLKTLLHITGSSEDSLLQAILASAQAQVVAYIGYNIENTTYTDEIFDLNGQKQFVLPFYPVTALTSIAIKNDSTWDPLTTYTLKSKWGIIVHDDFFPRWYARLKVTYSAGYTDTTVPSPIREAIIWLSTLSYHDNQSGGIKREKVDGASEVEYTDSKQATEKIFASLNCYRRYA